MNEVKVGSSRDGIEWITRGIIAAIGENFFASAKGRGHEPEKIKGCLGWKSVDIIWYQPKLPVLSS